MTRVRAVDVARAAGVSTTAVSFVLNGRSGGNIAPATRERVLAVAADLGYEPNRVAQSLRRQRTHTIGLVTDAIASSPFAGRMLAGATERAARDGYAVLTLDSHSHDEREQAAVEELERRQVDALIYASMGFRKDVAVPRSRGAVVLANCTSGADDELSVSPDDAGGARAALEHLVGLGHRRITMISGDYTPGRPGAEAGNVSGPLRAEAFLAAAHEHGLGTSVRVVEAGWDIAVGYSAAARVLEPVRDRPTAIFAVNDRVAAGVLLAAGSMGLRVPQDVSLIGFDDQESLASELVPALTTMALPHEAMGELAAEMALATVGRPKNEIEPRRVVLDCPIVVRDSTSPLAS